MVCSYDISGSTSMGNVNTLSLSDIWLGDGFNYYRQKHLDGRGREINICSTCTDWQYRSWDHNYWKVLNTAEAARRTKMAALDINDTFGSIVASSKE
jgi:hypothetical protein